MSDAASNEFVVLSARLDALSQRIDEAFTTRDKALAVALEAASKRLDGMNEFRAALTDQSAKMQTRSESEVLHTNTREKLEVLRLAVVQSATQFVDRKEFDSARLMFTENLGRLRPEVSERVDRMGLHIAGLVGKKEFEDARASLVERTEASRVNIEGKLAALTTSFGEKLEQYRAARDLRTETDLAPIRATLALQGKPNWGLFASMAAVSIGIISGAWLIVGLKIDNSVSPMTLQLESTKTQTATNTERVRNIEVAANASTQSDSSSRADRVQLNERVKQLELVVPPTAATGAEVANLKAQYVTIAERLSSLRTQVAQQQAALVEIETQFCGADNMRNTLHAYDMRFFSMMWGKVFGEKLPTDNAFYAQIGKCRDNVTVAGR